MDITVTKEKKRLEDLLARADVPEQKRAALAGVIDQLALLRVKLDEAGAELRDAPIICEYDNGGGQTGTRINPLYKAYTDLLRAYLAAQQQFTAGLPKELVEEATGGKNVLEIVKRRAAK